MNVEFARKGKGITGTATLDGKVVATAKGKDRRDVLRKLAKTKEARNEG